MEVDLALPRKFPYRGRERELALGPFPLITPSQARKLRDEAARLLVQGIDPVDARSEKRTQAKLTQARRRTFREAGEEFRLKKESEWTNLKHRSDWERSLRKHVYPVIGDVACADVDRAQVVRVLDPLQSRRDTMGRVRERIQRILDYAMFKGWRPEGPNPSIWRGNLEFVFNKKGQSRPHPSLSYRELPEFFRDLRACEGVAALALQFLVLTGLRSNEVCGARWEEIDLAERMWTVPPERMKRRKKHKVPLCDEAVDVLERTKIENGRLSGGRVGAPSAYLFPGQVPGQPITGQALTAVIQRMSAARIARVGEAWIDRTDGRPICIHGFRSTISCWANEEMQMEDVDRVVDAALAHKIVDATEAAYNRSTYLSGGKRQRLMQLYGEFATGVRSDADVVQLRA